MSNKSNGNSGNWRSRATDWKRPAGPPNVWRRLEAVERLAGGATRPVRFSIQDVPEDRYAEVIEHMAEFFVAEEATCKSLKLKEDKDAIDDFRLLWKYLLKIGISVGAFKLDSDNTLLDLVAVNVLYVVTDELNKALGDLMMNFKSLKARKLFEFMDNVSQHVDVCEIYNVDKYISALGLSVSPAFRGQKLAVRLLEVRDDIGQKYGLTATSTAFTGPSSQIQAERAGFETVFTQNYAEVLDEDGEPFFPDIQSKVIKIMVKQLQ